VLFVHGFCSSGATWATVIKNLKAAVPGGYDGDTVELYYDGSWVRDRNDDQAYYPDRGPGFHQIRQGKVYTITFYNPLAPYPFSDLAVNDVPIEQEAFQLSKVVDAIKNVNQVGKIDLVGHSQGGLVSRAYVEGLATDGTSQIAYSGGVRQIVTLDTPHNGASTFDQLHYPGVTCFLEDSVQRRELSDAPSSFLKTLNSVDIPPEVPVATVYSYPVDMVYDVDALCLNQYNDCVVTVASQDITTQTRYRCKPYITGVPNPVSVGVFSVASLVHTAVLQMGQTAAILAPPLIRGGLNAHLCASLGAGSSTRIISVDESPGGIWDVILSFFAATASITNGEGGTWALAANDCQVDVVAKNAGGQELDRKRVPATGSQRVSFADLPSGWSIAIEPTCDVTVSVDTSHRAPIPNDVIAPKLLVPIVLDVATGTARYTTELSMTNRGAAWARATMRYTSALGSGSGSGIAVAELPPGAQVTIPDAMAELRRQGLLIPNGSMSSAEGGTLLVQVSGAASESAVSVLARTTTATTSPQPFGAAGLAYAGVPPSTSGDPVTVFGLRQNASDRSNLAVFNPTSDPVTVKVTAYAGNASGVSRVISSGQALPGYGWYQWNSLLGGTGITSGWVTIERVSSSGSFNAYGVINDNVTNDGSFVTSTRSSVNGTTITVPALVETGSFRSELVLANKSGNPVTLTLSYRESLSPSSGAGGSTTVTLRPTEQLIIPEAINYLRGRGVSIGASGTASYAGALRISVNGASLSDVYAGARTASQSPAGGQFGLFTPGIYESEAATTDAYLYGLRSDELNRSNVAVANVGGDSSGPVTLVLHFFDGDFSGVETGGAETVTLAPGEWKQLSNILKTKGIRNGWVHVVRTSGSAPWIAYGVINDGGNPGERTGDGAYVPMVAGGGGTGNVVIAEFTVPTANSSPWGIASGPDGNLWFTEYGSNKIGRITTTGVITEFAPTASSSPWGIASGPDGNLWFTETGNEIGRITTTGVITEFTIPTASGIPWGIASGPDGNFWFTEYFGNKIGRITTTGVITEFTIPTASSSPWGIASGPDGNLWFTEYDSNKIGRITTTGVITEFTLPTTSNGPTGIASGPDGNLWFTETGSNKIGRISNIN
jgi:streptogramin lyase/pimeloyl-ACP methyl ester carboxylesterase